MRLSNMLLLQKAEPEPSRPEITNPLTFAPAEWEAGVYLTKTGNVDDSGIQYRIGREGAWTPYVMDDIIYIEEGQVVQFKNTNDTFSTSSSDYFRFRFEGSLYASGNIMSMLNGRPDVPAYAFYKLFYYANMYEPPELPATVIGPHCYEEMFAESNIETIPALPAPIVEECSYMMMFYGCGMLHYIDGFRLEGQIVKSAGCNGMFRMSGVYSVPTLNFEAIEESAFSHMFAYCDYISEVGNIFPSTLTVKTQSMLGMFRDCFSLISAENLYVGNVKSYEATMSHAEMFKNCRVLEIPPRFGQNIAPQCYKEMFAYCEMLQELPTLRARDLRGAENCYEGMFRGCTSITSTKNATEYATTLSDNCYKNMFTDCVSLMEAELPARGLVNGCYTEMFSGCFTLEKIDVNFVFWNNGKSTENWVKDVFESGIYICPTPQEEIRGTSYIPEGWSIERYDIS